MVYVCIVVSHVCAHAWALHRSRVNEGRCRVDIYLPGKVAVYQVAKPLLWAWFQARTIYAQLALVHVAVTASIVVMLIFCQHKPASVFLFLHQ